MKREKRSVTGLLLLDKPIAISSNAALTRAKLLYRAEKAGHTGTLDPFASGLLPICFGEATKFASFMLDANKTYDATIRLGRVTTTGDPEGEILDERTVTVMEADIKAALCCFTGTISQTPPMYSAIKFQGQPLYRLARQGIEVPRNSRNVTVYRIDLVAFESPFVKISVACSKGTYIRTLAEDIGQALGSGASLVELRRTNTGDFSLQHAFTLEKLSQLSLDELDRHLINPSLLVSHLPEIVLEKATGHMLVEGKVCINNSLMNSGTYRAFTESGIFLGLVDIAGEMIKARRMMSAAFISRADLS